MNLPKKIQQGIAKNLLDGFKFWKRYSISSFIIFLSIIIGIFGINNQINKSTKNKNIDIKDMSIISSIKILGINNFPKSYAEQPNNKKASIIGAVNSEIDDNNYNRIYVLPINYRPVRISKWLELRPPAIFSLQRKERIPLRLTEPIGVAFIGEKGSYNLKVSLYFKGELESHCYRTEVLENVKDNIINITIQNRWHPLLFCNNKQPKTTEGVMNILNANLPGKYSIIVNNQKIGEVEYTLESNVLVLKFLNQTYRVPGITQLLMFADQDTPQDTPSELTLPNQN